jgi:hypothetical protein
MKEARDLALRPSCLREVGKRSRVFEEFPLDFGRESTPSHDDGRSQRFQDFFVFGGSLINLQICRRLGHPLGAHGFRYSHARIALSRHGSATVVTPPGNSSVVIRICLMVVS